MTEAVAWVKWHFSKWRNEPTLRMCSLSARGLWADLLAIMHECEPYGHLVINGQKPSAKQIASMVGMTSEREVTTALKELQDNGVFSLTDNGVIYSRRLVRDKATRDLGKQTGSLGGNPKLRESVNPKHQGGLTPPVNPEKEKEKEREKEEDNPSLRSGSAREVKPKGTRIPPDWEPRPEEVALAADLGVDAVKARDEFRDYWLSRSRDAARSNWDLVFRNRLRELAEQGKFMVGGRRQQAKAPASKLSGWYDVLGLRPGMSEGPILDGCAEVPA